MWFVLERLRARIASSLCLEQEMVSERITPIWNVWRLAGVAVAPELFFLPYERVHKVPARIGHRQLQMRGNQFPELLENALLIALPLSLDSRFTFASLRE